MWKNNLKKAGKGGIWIALGRQGSFGRTSEGLRAFAGGKKRC
jgi:hypothetical protein